MSTRLGAEKDLHGGSCPGSSGYRSATASQPGYPASSPTAAPAYPVNSTKPPKAGSGQSSVVPGGVFMTVSSGGARQTSTPTSAASVAASDRPKTFIPSPAASTKAASELGSGTAPSGGYPAGAPCTSEGVELRWGRRVPALCQWHLVPGHGPCWGRFLQSRPVERVQVQDHTSQTGHAPGVPTLGWPSPDGRHQVLAEQRAGSELVSGRSDLHRRTGHIDMPFPSDSTVHLSFSSLF